MERIKQQIQDWKSSLLALNKNDVLLNIIPDENAINIEAVYKEEEFFSVEESALLKKINKQHQEYKKETGSPIFGIVKNIIEFELDEKKYTLPFLLANATLIKNRFNSKYEISQTEDFYLNPVLLQLTKIEDLSENIENAGLLLREKGLENTAVTGIWIANFHPHRYILQKELDELLKLSSYSSPFRNILGETSVNIPLQLAESYLFPADESQIEAIKEVENQDVVIQGPPGTGKSQVITNLIGKNLGMGNKTLLVAEKLVALEVIYDKLKEKNLHHFCVFYHHDLKSKQFVHSLEKTWNYLENLEVKSSIINSQAALLTKNIDFTLARLRQEDLIGGISYDEFQKLYPSKKESKYIFEKPLLKDWGKDKLILEQLITHQVSLFGAWKKVKLIDFDVNEINQQIERILHLIDKHFLEGITVKELREKLKISNYISLFYHNDYPINIEVFQVNSKQNKEFFKNFNTLKTLIEEEKLLEKEEEHWSKKFSLSELDEYIQALTSKKLSYNVWRTKRQLAKMTNLNFLEGIKTLENLKELYTVRNKIVKVKERLRKIDIPDDYAVLEHIQYTIKRLESADANDLQLIYKLSEKDRVALRQHNRQYQEIYDAQKTYFQLEEEESISHQLRDVQESLPKIVENLSLLKAITKDTYKAIQHHSNMEELNASIFYSHWLDFKGYFPELAQLKGKDLEDRIEKTLLAFTKEANDFSSNIQGNIKEKFEEYHALLQTPARKLTQEEKEFKSELRVGKAILIKAFSRKRVFPTVRELMDSEAKHWIQLLQPVFLCSSYSVAKSIPLSTKFDLVIFDEASQIPLSHAAGSIQRGKRVVICGDQQQMAPKFYFQKKNAQETDVLHHASFYWKNKMITHHYRSYYPQLIAYSNQYFYQNKLKTFPPPYVKKAIDCITLEGVFQDRKNEAEALKVAEIIIEKVKNKDFDFGLVAFSQTQLEHIRSKIPAEILFEIEEKGSYFMQSLENVQGDQCKHLLISLGYAKDESGKFRKHFGPLNQEQGHRRLNVLMSRAIEKITFVRSVTSSDFSISENDGVELLRKLMLFLEKEENATIQYDTSIPGTVFKGETIHIKNLSTSFKSGQGLIDFYRIYAERKWNITIDL